MAPQTAQEIAKNKVKVEAERRRRSMLVPTMEARNSKGAKKDISLIDFPNEINRGLLNLAPSFIREKANQAGIGVKTDLSDTMTGGALNMLGTSAPFALGIPALGSGPAVVSSKPVGMLQTFADDIQRYAMANPKTYLAAEGAAAMGSGAASQAAKNSEIGPTGQLLAEAAGGITAGGMVATVPRGISAARQAILANILPMTNEGGMIRSSRQMQQRAGGPERAEILNENLSNIPEGVTPAQWIGDERLMSQEARLLADDPRKEALVRQELEDARLAAQEELQNSFGQPRSRQQWELSLIERVAPEGSAITPAATDEMLDQAYRSFDRLYSPAKGYSVPAEGITMTLRAAPNDPSIISTDQERKAVSEWISNQLTKYKDDINSGEISSDDLLDLRSTVRNERRNQVQKGREERADLLGSVESSITSRLENYLPSDIIATLQAADSQYRVYKVVEDSIFRAGDDSLSAKNLSDAIQQGGLASSSRYARGQDATVQELRNIALGGRSTKEVLNNPERASQIVRGLSEPEKASVHADFVNVIFNEAKSPNATDSGIPFVSGKKLQTLFLENKDVMKNLGMNNFDILRLQNIAKELSIMENKPVKAVSEIFEDGPASLLQLGAAIIGSNSGQRFSSGGIGSGLVLAQYMSNKTRGLLSKITSDQAAKLMNDAIQDPELYSAMLLKKNAPREKLQEGARYVESWLLGSEYNKVKQEEN